ncbi:hypothetical protein BJ875DRAFT_490273 [Amylocarpus encephaloides]|uniref:Uncharacterized protein n=1 Tax=Amylocarpus encephaloides TaxID=45428 RepID=A0A9P7Y6Y4_9HELO|nr:hypothetical protein BJ875DRAFT_490273 [Amylocarpus encephaloides]
MQGRINLEHLPEHTGPLEINSNLDPELRQSLETDASTRLHDYLSPTVPNGEATHKSFSSVMKDASQSRTQLSRSLDFHSLGQRRVQFEPPTTSTSSSFGEAPSNSAPATDRRSDDESGMTSDSVGPDSSISDLKHPAETPLDGISTGESPLGALQSGSDNHHRNPMKDNGKIGAGVTSSHETPQTIRSWATSKFKGIWARLISFMGCFSSTAS